MIASVAILLASTTSIPAVAQDTHETELRTKVTELVLRDFGGDPRRAFDHYANRRGMVDRNGLRILLKDAGVGSWATRDMWVSGILDRFDKPPHGKGLGAIDWEEFKNAGSAAKADGGTQGGGS